MAEFIIRGAGDVLRKHRQEAGMTLETLAAKALIEKSQIAKYEANQVGISDERLAKLAKAMSIAPDVLAHECLLAIKPQIQSKPIGKLLGSLIASPVKKAKAPKTTKPAKRANPVT
ncbi:MAG: helix-turn-helix domain-containing protein [Fimbriiglobus sp.]